MKSRNVIKTKEQAVQAILRYEKCPLHIPKYKREHEEAYDFLIALPDQESALEAYVHIEEELNEYHRPLPSQKGYSHYDLDQMIINN